MDFARFEEAPNDTLNKLATRTHAPYFFTDEDLQTPPADLK